MIIKLKGADFSANNINSLLNSWPITFYGRTLVTGTFVSSVSKGSTYTATFSVADKCTVDSVSVTRGGTTVSGATISGGTITINVPTTTESGPISITFNGSKENGDDPVVPTNYTFTINPTPDDATVTLTASGYTQNGNSITVPNGTTVSWSVSADGYTEQTGAWTANGSDKTENVVLVASGGGETSDELAGTWLFNETISKENFGGKNGTVADLGVDAPAYKGYKVNYSIAPEGDQYNKSYQYLLANKSVELIGFYNTETNSAGGFYQNGAFSRSVFRTINVYSKLSEVENGDVLLAWFKANAVKQ